MPYNFHLATDLYKIKNTYPDFAIFQKSAFKNNILIVSKIIIELKDKVLILFDSTILLTYSIVTSLSKSCNRRIRFTKSYKYGF